MAIRQTLYSGQVNKIYQIVRRCLVLLTIITTKLMFLYRYKAIESDNSNYWFKVMRRISATSILIIMNMGMPHAVKMIIVGRALDNDLSLVTPAEDDQDKPPGIKCGPSKYANWVRILHPWVDLTANENIGFIRKPLSLAIIGIFKIISCIVQYVVCITIAWPHNSLVSLTTYYILQIISLTLRISISILLKVLFRLHYRRLKKTQKTEV